MPRDTCRRLGVRHPATALQRRANDDDGERFNAPGDDLERFMYGWSITTCLPDGRSREPSVAIGTVMRPDTLRDYAREAGFEGVEVLPIENDFFRFYRLTR